MIKRCSSQGHRAYVPYHGRACVLGVQQHPGSDPRVIIDGGVRKLRDGSAIAGSIATMERLIKTAVKEAGLPIEDVARMVSEHRLLSWACNTTARAAYADHKDADIIVMDKDLNLTHVFAMGRAVNLG